MAREKFGKNVNLTKLSYVGEYIKILIIECSWIAKCLVAILFSDQIFLLYDITVV